MRFGEKIQHLRKLKGWSQEQIAKQLDTSIAMVSKYERLDINASVEVAKKLATIFDVSLDYLVDESNEINPFHDKKMIERISKIQKMPEDQQAHITAIIDAFIRDYHTQKAYQ